MEELVFVTHNKGKAKSAEKYFNNLKFSTYDFELDEPRSDDIKEIVTAKVRQAYEIVKKPCIALDTGFFIEELNGFPRAFVNFSLDTIGVDGILKLMEGKDNRKCRFEECLAYHDGKEIHYFYGNHPGNLATKIQGADTEEKWSDLWYVFKPENFDKTLAEMDSTEREERRKIDGSVEALKVFAKWYEEKNTNIEIKFDINNNRAIALDNNAIIGECEFIEINECWNIVHTEVNSSYQGQGIARKLVESVIENASINNKKIVADCSYAKKVIDKKGENK